MGGRRTGQGYDRTAVPKAERIELVRRLLVAGVPAWQIRRELVDGIALDDGRVVKCTRATAHKYLDEVGLEYRALHDDPLVAERVVGAASERLARIADKAEAAGNFQAAIRANLALVDVVARRSSRWARKPDELPQAPAGATPGPGGSGYDDLSDAELLDKQQRSRERVTALKLIKGGS